jgi:hypothetical protein
MSLTVIAVESDAVMRVMLDPKKLPIKMRAGYAGKA